MSERHIRAGIVIGGVNYGESDRVITFLTDEGRVSAFAPSARKSRRRYGGALEPFTSVRLELGRARSSGLPTLLSVDVVRFRFGLSQDLGRLALASYASELCGRLAVEGAPTDLPAHLEGLLDVLIESPATRALRRGFELGVLRELGYHPQLEGCVQCGLPAVFLDLERGGVFCRSHRGAGREIGPRTLAWMDGVLRSATSRQARAICPSDAERAAAAVAKSLDAAFGRLLERPLGSARLLSDVGL